MRHLLNVMEIIIERITEPTELQKFFMSDTPRTDKLEKAQYNHICGSSNDPADLLGAACNEMADLCRELERELKGAVRQIDKSRSYKRVLKTENNRLRHENARLRELVKRSCKIIDVPEDAPITAWASDDEISNLLKDCGDILANISDDRQIPDSSTSESTQDLNG
jgi:regulator of replication initiation timing